MMISQLAFRTLLFNQSFSSYFCRGSAVGFESSFFAFSGWYHPKPDIVKHQHTRIFSP
jgi:hypothetical protein